MNRGRPWIVGAIGLIALFMLIRTFFFVVDQRQQAVVLQFGDPVRVVRQPGLEVKLPWQEVIAFDNRNQALDADQEEVIAADQVRMMVDAFIRYRITDPLQYYRTLGNDTTAHDRLDRIVNSSLREVLGTATSTDIISGRRSQLMLLARNEVIGEAQASRLGIQIIDLRIKRADYPQANEEAIFTRMKTARQQMAAQLRAQGEMKRRQIMAQADKQVAITIAQADEQASETRGQGDAQRATLFAQSFGRDPKFAAFYRSMQAYETALGQGDTTMVLAPDSDFFKYFKNGPGR